MKSSILFMLKNNKKIHLNNFSSEIMNNEGKVRQSQMIDTQKTVSLSFLSINFNF